MSCTIKRVITFKEPVKYGKIVVYDDNENDITNSCMYSWSSDGLCWVSWTDFNTYNAIAPSIESDYYLRILIFGGLCKIAYNDVLTECYSICIYNENPFITDFCGNANLLNPYANLDCALMLQQQLADSVICMFGLPCYYFKVNPDNMSADYTFKEYVLHNVSDVKIVKLMCQDGQLPSSNPQMTEFDFDWDSDWEVEVGKSDFAKAFGDTAFPKQRDFVYIPMMKRMYEVNAAYDEKQEGLMWRSTTWKLALIKWNEKTNVEQGAFEDIIDSFIVNKYDEVFHKELVEQERVSGAAQAESPKYAATNLFNLFLEDAVRESITKTEIHSIIPMQTNNRSLVVGRNAYAFITDGEVNYQNRYCGDDGVFSLIFEMGAIPDAPKAVVHIGENALTIGNEISFCGLSAAVESNNTYMVVCRWSKSAFVCEMDIYKYVERPNVPKWKLRPEMHWFEKLYSKTGIYNTCLRQPDKVHVSLTPFGIKASNFKLFDNYMDAQTAFEESTQYTTTSKHCIINDVARPIEGSHGYSVR